MRLYRGCYLTFTTSSRHSSTIAAARAFCIVITSDFSAPHDLSALTCLRVHWEAILRDEAANIAARPGRHRRALSNPPGQVYHHLPLPTITLLRTQTKWQDPGAITDGNPPPHRHLPHQTAVPTTMPTPSLCSPTIHNPHSL